MKTITNFTVTALMAALVQAAPMPSVKEARQPAFTITFFGAGPNPPSYTIKDAGRGVEFPIGTMSCPCKYQYCVPLTAASFAFPKHNVP